MSKEKKSVVCIRGYNLLKCRDFGKPFASVRAPASSHIIAKATVLYDDEEYGYGTNGIKKIIDWVRITL